VPTWVSFLVCTALVGVVIDVEGIVCVY